VAALATTGFDPFVGRKLFSMARNAGLTNIDVQAECYHLIVGEADPHILKQWELKLEIAGPQMSRVLGSESEARKQSQAFLDFLRRPDTLTYSTVFTGDGGEASMTSSFSLSTKTIFAGGRSRPSVRGIFWG